MTPSLGIESGPHWWEASALTTAPSLHPNLRLTTKEQCVQYVSHDYWDLLIARVYLCASLKTRICLNFLYDWLIYNTTQYSAYRMHINAECESSLNGYLPFVWTQSIGTGLTDTLFRKEKRH